MAEELESSPSQVATTIVDGVINSGTIQTGRDEPGTGQGTTQVINVNIEGNNTTSATAEA